MEKERAYKIENTIIRLCAPGAESIESVYIKVQQELNKQKLLHKQRKQAACKDAITKAIRKVQDKPPIINAKSFKDLKKITINEHRLNDEKVALVYDNTREEPNPK